MKIELRDFTVPHYVIQVSPAGRREEGWREAPKYALSELPAEELALLCDRFRAAVFDKAGKDDPKEAR